MSVSASLSLDLSLSRPVVLPDVPEGEPLYVLLRVGYSGVRVFRCSGVQADKVNDGHAIDVVDPEHLNTRTPEHLNIRPPVHLTLVLDASGSMHRIVLEGAERDHWRQVAEERGDLKRGRVDGGEGWLWSGRTLTELQARHRTPMQAALRALTRAGDRLQREDRLTVIAFADRARELVAAGAGNRDQRIEAAVALLSGGVEASGLGDGTRLAEALRLALEEAVGHQRSAEGEAALRLLLISDGLIEDRVACGAWVERVAEAGITLSCIGVGNQFDEEWLMWAADTTRGRFRYAPTADDLEAAVAEELDRLQALAACRLTLALRPLGGALFRDLCQVAPELSALHRVETDGAIFRFSLGDLSQGREALFLTELSLPPLPPGDHPVLAVELTGESPGGEPLVVTAAEAVICASTDLAAEVDAADLEAVAAVHAYRAERRAQRALRRGQIGEATRHLRDTRQIVERLGRFELAAELEAHAGAMEAGKRLSAEQAKRIKAGTRRLVSDPPDG